MARILDHIDLRVRRLVNVQAFYEALLPALGFTRDASIEGWFQFEADSGAVTEFFGITESPNHVPNETRIAFWAESIHEVDRLTAIITTAGARHIEGPAFETPSYYAVFFEDPCGNRLEICHRTSSATES